MTDLQLCNEVTQFIINDQSFLEKIKTFLVNESDVIMEVNGKQSTYKFVGCGCGITYLTISDKRDSLAKQLKNIQYKIEEQCRNWLISQFSSEEIKYFESIGCPLTAIFSQDQGVQIEIYRRIVKWGNMHGCRYLSFNSRLD